MTVAAIVEEQETNLQTEKISTEIQRTFLTSCCNNFCYFCYRKFRVNIKLLVVCGKREKYFAVHVDVLHNTFVAQFHHFFQEFYLFARLAREEK